MTVLENTQQPPAAESTPPNGTPPPAQQAPPTPEPGKEDPTTFDKAYVQELRAEAAKYRTKLRELEAEQQKAKDEAERQKLESKGQYDEALKKTLDKIAELESKATVAERYESLANKMLEAQREALPDYVVALLEKMPKVDQIEWLIENGQKLSGSQNGQTRAGQERFNPPGAPQPLTDRQRIDRLNQRRGVTPTGLF